MCAGKVWEVECSEYTDSVSGVKVRQLTNYKGHSHHFYFTNSGWYDGGRKLLFGSDRENRTNLFSLELSSGAITQLTDLEPLEKPYGVDFLGSCVNPRREEAYFWYGRQLTAIDLTSLELRPLWEAPEGFLTQLINCTTDGRYVCAGVFEDLSSRFMIDYGAGYIGFRETWEARPLSRIVKVATDGSYAETVWEERYWIGHINTSPTQPNLITFCHEGPWGLVDNRIWGLDLDTGKVWQIRPREAGESLGHEYWLADGVRIGYHGRTGDNQNFLGRIKYDNTERIEFTEKQHTGHTHSNDFSLIVGDGGQVVKIWRSDGEKLEGPRVLCEHRSSFHIQKVHVHPRFSPDSSYIIFTSDRTGYGNIYLVVLPDFYSLPPVE